MNNKRGFTLIELLVVVLIIGILAAVAIPQYTRTIERSRSTEALLSLKALSDAANRVFMMRDGYQTAAGTAITLNDLDVQPPVSTVFNYDIAVAAGFQSAALMACRAGAIAAGVCGGRYEIIYNVANGQFVDRECNAVAAGNTDCNGINL